MTQKNVSKTLDFENISFSIILRNTTLLCGTKPHIENICAERLKLNVESTLNL